MNIFLIFITCLCVSNCNSIDEKHASNDSIAKVQSETLRVNQFEHSIHKSDSISLNEDSLYNMVQRIVEVKELIKKVNSNSSNQKVAVLLSRRPGKGFLYYWFEVGVDDGSRLQPVYNFYIDKDRLQIMYYDTANDSVVSLKEWRAKRGW